MKPCKPSPSNMFSDLKSERHTIRNNCFEAAFQPLAGGRMLYLRHTNHGDLLIPLRDASFDPEQWPKAGAFPLFPFHNRLRNAAFRYDGRLIELRPNAANGTDTMHGPAHRRPWKTTKKSANALEMALGYHADEEWPFDFTAIQHFELREDHLSINLHLTNTDNIPMPCGIGWHPYFIPARDAELLTDAENCWNPLGSTGFPERRALGDDARNGPIQIDSTAHYSDWTQTSAWIGNGTKITLIGGSRLSHLVVLRKAEYLCLEPASHVAGAFTTLPEPPPETGLCLLAPGETLSGTLKLWVDLP